MLNRSLHQDSLSEGSNGQTKQDLAVQHRQHCMQVQALQISCHLHPPPWLWNMDPVCWLCKRDPGFQNKTLHISYLEHKTNNLVQSKINFLVGPQEALLAAVKRWKFACSGMSTTTTASQKPSFKAPWRVGNAVGSRGISGNAGWTTSKSEHLCPRQNHSQGPPAEKTGRGSLLNHPLCLSDDLIDQGTKLNWTEPLHHLSWTGPSFTLVWCSLETDVNIKLIDRIVCGTCGGRPPDEKFPLLYVHFFCVCVSVHAPCKWTLLRLCSVQFLHQLNHRGDMRDDSPEILFQSFLREATVSRSGVARDLDYLTWSIQHFLYWPGHHPPSKVPWRTILERLSWHVTCICLNHGSVHLLIVTGRDFWSA